MGRTMEGESRPPGTEQPTADEADSSPPSQPDESTLTDVGTPSLRARLTTLGASAESAALADGVGIAIGDQIDRVASFRPAILAIRWGTTAVSLALAAPDFAVPDWPVVFWCAAILSYTLFRTFEPDRYTDDARSVVTVIGEVTFHTLAVGTTGAWESPFVFSLVTAVIVAGFARGFGFALRIAGVSALLVTIPYLSEHQNDSAAVRLSVQWSVSLLLVALVAGYARRISGEADRQHSLALDRLGRLADANALLFSLHRVTQTLPASLDLDEVIETTISRLKSLFDLDAVVILAFDEVESQWEVLAREGVRLPPRLAQVELPPPLQQAVADQSVHSVPDLVGEEGPGLFGRSGSGMYAALLARDALIGLISVERDRPDAWTSRDLELFRGFVRPVALAIDNARWFSRLRTVGADEERTRIARDLHDRIGQSLAYVAFELDRLVERSGGGTDVSDDLGQLRSDVRGVIGEVRDTLYDLRTDVTEELGMAEVLAAFAERVRERSGLDIEVHCDRDRLPILQEREMWRIAQEALTNVERHANATRVVIKWQCNGRTAHLDIGDDGRGFPIGQAGRMDSYGLLGMKERASSIGALFEITSTFDQGTRVRCHLIES
jgi:signal transduction histidine kinase